MPYRSTGGCGRFESAEHRCHRSSLNRRDSQRLEQRRTEGLGRWLPGTSYQQGAGHGRRSWMVRIPDVGLLAVCERYLTRAKTFLIALEHSLGLVSSYQDMNRSRDRLETDCKARVDDGAKRKRAYSHQRKRSEGVGGRKVYEEKDQGPVYTY